MRTWLNELGYHVTREGVVVYKRKSRPFTLKRIVSIFNRSFLPWWDESQSGERMDAVGFFSPARNTREDLTRNFTTFIEETTKMSTELAKISVYFYDYGPNIAQIITPKRVGVAAGIKNLIEMLKILLKLIEES